MLNKYEYKLMGFYVYYLIKVIYLFWRIKIIQSYVKIIKFLIEFFTTLVYYKKRFELYYYLFMIYF